MAFRINRVYTRSGDHGETGLVGGSRVQKCDPRVAAYGDIDELNSLLGAAGEAARDLPPAGSSLGPLLEFLQQELFNLGSQLATPAGSEYQGMWRVAQLHIDRLEALCDGYGAGLPELASFVLPGGSKTAAALHVARSVARRAERSILLLAGAQPGSVALPVLAYVNRLSDLLFVLSRWVLSVENRSAPLWTQESGRVLPDAVQRIVARAVDGKPKE